MKRLPPLLALPLVVIALRAQTATGAIEGVVKDDSGAVIAGARLSSPTNPPSKAGNN